MKIKILFLNLFLLIALFIPINLNIEQVNLSNQEESLAISSYDTLPNTEISDEAMQENLDAFEVDLSQLNYSFDNRGNLTVSNLIVTYNPIYSESINRLGEIAIKILRDDKPETQFQYNGFITSTDNPNTPEIEPTYYEFKINNYNHSTEYSITEIILSYESTVTNDFENLRYFFADSNLNASNSPAFKYITEPMPGGIVLDIYQTPNWLVSKGPIDASSAKHFEASYVVEDVSFRSPNDDIAVYFSTDNSSWQEANILYTFEDDGTPDYGNGADIEIYPLEPDKHYDTIYLSSDPQFATCSSGCSVASSTYEYILVEDLHTEPIQQFNGGKVPILEYFRQFGSNIYALTIDPSIYYEYPYSKAYINSLYYQPEISFDGGQTWNVGDIYGDNTSEEVNNNNWSVSFNLTGKEPGVRADQVYYDNALFRINANEAVTPIAVEPYYDYGNIEPLEVVETTTNSVTFKLPDDFLNYFTEYNVDTLYFNLGTPNINEADHSWIEDFDKFFFAQVVDGQVLLTIDKWLEPGTTYNHNNNTYVIWDRTQVPHMLQTQAFLVPLPSWTTKTVAQDNLVVIIVSTTVGGTVLIATGLLVYFKKFRK